MYLFVANDQNIKDGRIRLSIFWLHSIPEFQGQSLSEMQKVADAADISVLFFWVIFGSIWAIFGHFWAILGNFR